MEVRSRDMTRVLPLIRNENLFHKIVELESTYQIHKVWRLVVRHQFHSIDLSRVDINGPSHFVFQKTYHLV